MKIELCLRASAEAGCTMTQFDRPVVAARYGSVCQAESLSAALLCPAYLYTVMAMVYSEQLEIL